MRTRRRTINEKEKLTILNYSFFVLRIGMRPKGVRIRNNAHPGHHPPPHHFHQHHNLYTTYHQHHNLYTHLTVLQTGAVRNSPKHAQHKHIQSPCSPHCSPLTMLTTLLSTRCAHCSPCSPLPLLTAPHARPPHAHRHRSPCSPLTTRLTIHCFSLTIVNKISGPGGEGGQKGDPCSYWETSGCGGCWGGRRP